MKRTRMVDRQYITLSRPTTVRLHCFFFILFVLHHGPFYTSNAFSSVRGPIVRVATFDQRNQKKTTTRTTTTCVFTADPLRTFRDDGSRARQKNGEVESPAKVSSVTKSTPFWSVRSAVIATTAGFLVATAVAASLIKHFDDAPYTVNVYALLGLAGGLGCAITHLIVVPLDVVKTRTQMESSSTLTLKSTTTDEATANNNNRPPSLWQAANRILETEGWAGLTRGWRPTVAGYLWYGVSVYPSYTFVRRVLCTGVGLRPETACSLLAGVASATLASFGLTPMEACRIRAVSNEPDADGSVGGGYDVDLFTALSKVAAEEEGGAALYKGFPSLWTRQVLFGAVKFLTYETTVDLLTTSSVMSSMSMPSWAVSLLAGAVAGTVSCVVSQPADSVLTYVNDNNNKNNNIGTTSSPQKPQNTNTGNIGRPNTSAKPMGVLEGSVALVRERGPAALFRGLGSRCVWAGSIIAGQFFLYDVFRTFLGVDQASLDLIQDTVYQIVIEDS